MSAQFINDLARGKPASKYKPTLTNIAEANRISSDPGLSLVKDQAEIASFIIPGGKGVSGLAKAGAASGALQGFGSSRSTDIGGLLKDTATGAGIGGAIGGGVGLATKATNPLLSKLAKKSDEFVSNREMNAFKRNVGTTYNAAKGGAKVEKQIAGYAKKYGVDVGSSDDLVKVGDKIFEEYGGVIQPRLDGISQRGVRVNIDDVIAPLNEKLSKIKSAELRQPLETVIERVKSQSKDGTLSPSELYQLKQEWGDMGSFSALTDPSQKNIARAYNDIYRNSNNVLEGVMKGAGFDDFKQINNALDKGIRAKDWARKAEAVNRPTGSFGDMTQDAAIVGGVVTGGNPIGAAGGALLSKFTQSPMAEKALANTAKGLSGVLKGAANATAPRQVNPLIAALARGTAQQAGMTGLNMASQPRPAQASAPQMPGAGAPTQRGLQGEAMLPALALQIMSTARDAKGQPLYSYDQAEKIARAQLQVQGYDVSEQGKMTEKQGQYAAASTLANEALQMLESGQVNTGKIASVGNKIGNFFGTTDDSQTAYSSKLASARGTAINALSGANVPPSEYQRIAAMIPEVTDEPKIARQKLRSFVEAMNTYSQSSAGTQPSYVVPTQ